MRCPQCSGEIPEGSRFCGICGRNIEGAPPAAARSRSMAPPADASMSLFELPVSRGARLARVIAVLALDAVLVGAGIFMIVEYLGHRAERRAEAAPAPKQVAIAGEVEVLSPSPVPAGEGRGGGTPTPDPVKPTPANPKPNPVKPDPVKPQPSKPPAKPQPPGVVLPPPGPADPPPDEPVDDGFDELPPGGLPPDEPPPDAGAPDEPPEPPAPPADDAGSGPDDEQVSLSAEQVRQVVDDHLGQLRRCYERAAKTTSPDEPLEGRIDIQFAIMPSGTASNVRTVSNTTSSDELADCVAGLIESWQFPSPGQDSIEFVWPFVFKAPR